MKITQLVISKDSHLETFSSTYRVTWIQEDEWATDILALNSDKLIASYMMPHPMSITINVPAEVNPVSAIIAQMQMYPDALDAMMEEYPEIGLEVVGPSAAYSINGILYTNQAPTVTAGAELALCARKLPGMGDVVKPPCSCKMLDPKGENIYTLVQHLNDHIDHRWTRGRIADWLETLDVDLEFK